ncbi:Protein of unknown function DUF373 [Methanocaldococcus infernus ME]|uniref:DUF373 family protein n=1 Tax=Methanocaldococcus infernus (strain DSM 11812 / JCM 15783 / ME) TaxID=573063 RepID=D5VQH1_METIM|nr:DUF373 family protein [Methanocaldococcus infernus]ADG12824.1 Protein of unknown function DUF373 [Methanocaldococcus infernus ME]
MYLVLIVDLDDDVGRKAGLKTPILGREECIKAAIKLGLSDPGDSDINSILGGVKLYDELKKEGAEIAIVSGSKDVESKECAEKIKGQLDFLLNLYSPKFIYVVSDGKEDELIINYLKGHDIFVWKKRIVVKQSETLESTYYLLQEFIKKTMEEYIPLILTFVGFSFLLYAIFADMGWRLVIGILGIYILAEASGVRKKLFNRLDEGSELINIEPISYAAFIVVILLGILYSYSVTPKFDNLNLYIGEFILNFLDPLTLSLIILLVGRFISRVINLEENIFSLIKRYIFYLICIFILREFLANGAKYIMGTLSFLNFSLYVIVYLIVIIILTVILFSKESGKK